MVRKSPGVLELWETDRLVGGLLLVVRRTRNVGPMMSDEERGLYRKYRVVRLNDPTGKHDECPFFVLDIMHDQHARNALCAYANSCRVEFPQLAADLHAMLATEALFRDEDTVQAALVRALETAINSVACDSTGPDGEELPWYVQAKAALKRAKA